MVEIERGGVQLIIKEAAGITLEFRRDLNLICVIRVVQGGACILPREPGRKRLPVG